MMGDTRVVFGDTEREYLQLALGSVSPDDEPYKAVTTKIDMRVGGFVGAVSACVFTGELRSLLRELRHMQSTLSGTIDFRTLEGQIDFKATLSPTGHLPIEGHLQDDAGHGNDLRFTLSLDQTHLPTPIAALDAFFETLP